MADAGAAAVLGIDPTLLYVMQFLAVTAHLERPPVAVLPLRLQELPDACHAFDTTFSMGVLYHQRSPLDHLRQLRGTLCPGGQLVLETIFIPGEESYACTPAERYARMKFDRPLHDRLLNEVLAADPQAKDYTLSNTLAQRQAHKLLNSADEYF